MSEVRVIGDLHFGHVNAIPAKFRTDVPTVRSPDGNNVLDHEAYCEWVVEEWNSVVRPNDTVFVLGDFAFSEEYLWRYAPRLKGTKRLVLGNHDTPRAETFLMAGFKTLDGALEYRGALLTHVPVVEREAAYYRFNVHGHSHHGDDYGPYHFNAIPEVVGYRPIPWVDIEMRMDEKQKSGVWRPDRMRQGAEEKRKCPNQKSTHSQD